MSLPIEPSVPLPKIDLPLYNLTVPSTGESIKVRPFTVKEEKLLFMAAESHDTNYVIDTVLQVLNNCIVKGNVNLDKLPFFDVDYIFIFLRAKSIGETIDIKMTCNNIVDDKKCGNVFDAKLDIGKVEIVKQDISNDIKLTGDKGVRLKYPTYAMIKRLENANDIDNKTHIIANSIDYIYDKKGAYSSKDYSKEDLVKFVEDLTEENYKKLENYIDNFPAFVAVLQEKCGKCGFEHNVRYSDFYDFFT